MSDLIHAARTRPLLSVLTVAFILALLPGASYASSLYFIRAKPGQDMSQMRPFPTVMYRYDEVSKTLEEVWSLPDNVWAHDVDIFSGVGLVIMPEGHYSAERLHIWSTADIGKPQLVDLSEYGTVFRYRLFETPDRATGFEIALGNTRIPVEVTPGVAIERTSETNGEPRLAGLRGEYGGIEFDVIGVHVYADGSLDPAPKDLSFGDLTLPDSIVQIGSAIGWTLIVNEPLYQVFFSIPDRHGLDQCEYLIYYRRTGKWSSFLVEGYRTSLKLINGWLVGVVADTDPETDYRIRKGFPPLLREESILLDPLAKHQFKVHLGPQSEVLWVSDDSTAYYRVGDSLFRARIADDDFVDRQLLIQGPEIKQIHWAFEATVGDE